MRMLAGHPLQQDLVAAIAPALQAIAASIGPEGRHVLYRDGSRIRAARTGSQIARRVCSDHFAARLLKETLVDAERQFGDGTARLAVMAGAALTAWRRAGPDGPHVTHVADALIDLRPVIDAAFAAETHAATQSEAQTAALIAASGCDAALAGLIADARTAARGGLIEVREGAATAVAQGAGFCFEATALGTTPPASLTDIHLIVANEVLTDFGALTPVIEGFATSGKALVVVARGIEGAALQLLDRNRQAGILRCAALVPADAGPAAAETLEDLAAATGATLVSAETGTAIGALKPAMLGRAARFNHARGRVELAGATGEAPRIAMRIALAEAEITAKRYLPLDRERAERRRARLAGRWAELTLASGPDTDARVETARRAIAALHSADKDGTIPGAGRGLDAIADRLRATPSRDPARRLGALMIDAALRAPGDCLRRNSTGAPLQATADPARLTRDLLDVALSLATGLAGIDGAALRP